MHQIVWLSLTVLHTCITYVQASAGDRSWTFVECLQRCRAVNCTTTEQLAAFAARQPTLLKRLGWDCDAECQHVCMWKAVDDFDKDGIPQQQYYGKWPFIRVFGIQEPASTLFSLLNGLSHVVMLIKFRWAVPSQAPMFYIWHLYSLVSINAWLWSTVFHTRDTNFTEKMDYFSAILMVLVSLFIGCVRLSFPKYHRRFGGLAGVCIFSYFIYHVYYLTFVRFDYGYNMLANVVAGLINAISWLWWCYKVRERQPYVWRASATVILVCVLLLLELLDFPPFMWTIDAHSLWHLGTIPLPLLWYRFVIDDCIYLMKSKEPTDVKSLAKKID